MSAVCTLESPDLRRSLLMVARQAARKVLGLPPGMPDASPVITGRFGGAFVTFWAGKRLRGCVGTFVPTEDIVGTIRDVTRQSLADSRFVTDPIRATELENLDIEVSILSDLERSADPTSLIPGLHGILVRQAGRTGCFLPRVAAERGWTAEELLSQCCAMKAGLPRDAWRLPGAEVMLFTADVFGDPEFRLSVGDVGAPQVS